MALPDGMTVTPLREKWTREGVMWFRELRVPIPADWAMKAMWKQHKSEFVARGFSIRQHNGAWFLQQWLIKAEEDYTLTQVGQRMLNALICPDELALDEAEPEEMQLEALPYGYEEKLFDYQVQPARQLFRALMSGEKEWGYPGAWDCSDLGTGKTYQALAAALATGLEVGIICPLSVIPAWQKAFRHFGQCPRFIRNYESLRTGKRDYVSIEPFVSSSTGKSGKRFRWNLEPKDTCLLFDEAHTIKNSGTRNQALAIAAIRQRFPLVCISGTLASDPTHMRATGRVVGLHLGGNGEKSDWTRFLKENGCEVAGGATYFIGGRRGRAILANINRMVFPRRGARTKIADLGDRFPETQIMAEAFDTGETAKISAAYKEAQRTIQTLESQGKPEHEVRMLKASAYLKAWHDSERLKVPAIVDMVKQEIEEGRSVAIFVNFTDVREALMKALKSGCAIFGGQPGHLRQRAIEEFQDSRSRVIIANIDAGGVGVSLHDELGEHPRTAIILPTNKVTSLTQALGRVHRAGGKSRSRQMIFFAAGTIEEQICDAVRAKMGNIASLNDGDLNPEAKF